MTRNEMHHLPVWKVLVHHEGLLHCQIWDVLCVLLVFVFVFFVHLDRQEGRFV